MHKNLTALLGAGASASCGLPTMWAFVDEWLDRKDEQSQLPLAHWILRGWGHPGHATPQHDLEGLLTILQDLSEQERPTGTSFGIELGVGSLHYPWVRARHYLDEQVGFKTQGHSAGRFREWYTSDNPLIDFVLSHESNKEWTWKYVPNEARAIFNDLKEFMLTRLATVDSDQARNMFLEFLHLLLDDESRAYCFSLNYDLVLEDALNGSQWVLERGFDHTGRWRGLDLNGSGRPKLILGKMHGSLDWTLDEHRQPIATATKGRVPPETLVVYPVATKQWYRQPFFSLISSFSDRLMESDVLIIVGCSLRDEAIVSVVSDACNRNKSLRLIVVSPRMSDLEVRQQLSLAAQTIVRLINTRWLGPETVAALSAQIETA